MKYLIEYNLFESNNESYLNNTSIDWEVINTAKDLALEHLDAGLELEYKLDYNKLTVLSGRYSHIKDKETWSGSKFKYDVELDSDKLIYCFYYNKNGDYVNYGDLSKELTNTLKEIYPYLNIVEDRWSDYDEVQALRIHLRDYGMEEDDIYSISSQLYKHYDLATIYEFEDMDFISCDIETAMKIAKEYVSGLDEQDLLMVKLYFRFGCVDEDGLAKEMIGDGDQYREDWEYIDDIKADENGDMDEESFEAYLKNEIESYKNDISTELVSNFGEEDSLKIIKQNLNSDWLERMTNGLVEADGLGHTLSSYDGKEYVEYYNGVDYHIFRIN